MTRREMVSLLPAALVLSAAATADSSLPSMAIPFDQLPVRKGTGAEFRHIVKGKLATGEPVEMHETTLQPGSAPHAPHHHLHSEFWLIREGTVELTINGKSQTLGPGSVGYVASNEEHGIKNSGSVPATYFVVAIGPGVDGSPSSQTLNKETQKSKN